MAALSSMKFCTSVHLDNHSKPREFQGQRPRSCGFFCGCLCAWCCGYPRTVLSIEQGLMI